MTLPSSGVSYPLRVAVFTDNFHPELGGIQDSILASARELGARGHRIAIFAPAAADRDYARAGLPVAEPDMGPNVSVRRLFSLPVPSSSQQSRLAVPIGRCRREIALLRPDVIHSHTFLGVGLEALWAARGAGVPLVGTNHWAVGAFDLYAPVARAAFRRLAVSTVTRYYQRCDRVTGPSRFTVDDMLHNGLCRPCSVISNPIDTRSFHPLDDDARRAIKQRWGLTAATIVYAGRMAREKSVDVLIRALAGVRAQRPQAMLVLAGHGSARDSLAALARDCGVGDAVRFVGTLPHAALGELFAASEVFAIASKSETQSMVVLQAMACSLPAVGARFGGLIEHIPPEAGLLADPDRPDDFRDKLLTLLGDPSARMRMGAAARHFAESFSVDSIADAWENLYRQAARDAGPDRRAGVARSKKSEGKPTCA
ncbi:MAG: glycosyltransferase [Gammaproteobacteria bacterium]|nr:glycosyltransferase [Gammaproteobacteria bacterium]